MRDSNRDQAYAMCALFCHFKSWSDAWAFCLLKQRKQEIDGVAWAATLGFPRAYLARGAEIAETEQRAITLKQLKVHSWQSCPGVPLASVDAILKQAQQKNKFTVSSGKFLRDHKGKEVDWNSVPWVWASEQFFDWALLMEQADLHLDDIELLEAREQRLDEEGGYVNLYVINDCIESTPPAWWLKGQPRDVFHSRAEVELLSQLAVLLMPDEPIAEAFRDFPVPKSKEWGSSRLCPDFSAYGVLKRAGAALFIEYDGYYRHMEPQGLRRDVRKTSALLKFAPAGSVVLRIAHKERPWKDKSVQVLVDCWQSEHVPSLHKTVEQFVASLLQSCRTELVPGLVSRLEVRVPPQIDKHAKTFAMDAELVGNASSTNRLALQEFLRKKMQLSTVQVAKSIVRFPSVLGLSIEANLKPTVEWIKGLGLSPSQVAKVITSFPQVLGLSIEVAKVIATCPAVLGFSIEANLKPTVEWIKGLGLSQSQVAKVIATFPQVLGLSMEANLKPTVECIKGLGLSPSQVAKVITSFPAVLGLSIEANLKPTVKWIKGLDLSQSQVAKVIATCPAVLGLSIEANLKPTVEWVKGWGLSQSQVVKVIATRPAVLGYSIEENLKPTVQWIKGLGLSQSQVAKVIATSPAVLGLSIEANLKPTVELVEGLGLSQSQVAKVIATCPAVLGYSIDANLKPTVEWIKGLGLSQSQVAKVIATFPQVLGLNVESNLRVKYVLIESFFPGAAAAELLARAPCLWGYRHARLEYRLHVLQSQGQLSKLFGAMTLG
ncbi:MTERF4, partial [Symbiodinium sp. KB8]